MDEKTPAAVAQPKNEPRPANVVDRAKEYVADLQAEMRRVTWPSWKQVRATTTVVVVAVFLFAGYFYAVDLIVGNGIKRLYDAFSR